VRGCRYAQLTAWKDNLFWLDVRGGADRFPTARTIYTHHVREPVVADAVARGVAERWQRAPPRFAPRDCTRDWGWRAPCPSCACVDKEPPQHGRSRRKRVHPRVT
jgi:hypothetical protein